MVSASDRSGASTAEQSGDLERPGDFNALLLAMAGHDLRQPLQVILNVYERLAGHHTEGREREYIERGELAVAQLTKQLDHLVTALRLHERAGGGERFPVQLGPLLAALCKENSDLAAEKAIDLCAMPTRAVVASDAVLLEGILRNLIHNALKYTPAGGRVLIGCRRRGDQICIEVHDTGVGIPQDHLSRIFEAFYRFDAHTLGLGLGLFIVARATDLLGHRVHIQSTVGRGSCFAILADAAVKVGIAIRPGDDRSFTGLTSGRGCASTSPQFRANLPALWTPPLRHADWVLQRA